MPLKIWPGIAEQKCSSFLPKAFHQWIQHCSGGKQGQSWIPGESSLCEAWPCSSRVYQKGLLCASQNFIFWRKEQNQHLFFGVIRWMYLGQKNPFLWNSGGKTFLVDSSVIALQAYWWSSTLPIMIRISLLLASFSGWSVARYPICIMTDLLLCQVIYLCNLWNSLDYLKEEFPMIASSSGKCAVPLKWFCMPTSPAPSNTFLLPHWCGCCCSCGCVVWCIRALVVRI